jgi:hypothetical protein
MVNEWVKSRFGDAEQAGDAGSGLDAENGFCQNGRHGQSDDSG